MSHSIRYVHRAAGVLAFLIILSFFSSTLFAELIGTEATIVAVKAYVACGVWVLIPMMMVAGISGAKMAPNANAGPVASKKKRMPFIALNGLLILLPCALYLQTLANSGRFDATFYSVQALELTAGLINLTLMSLNIRDGIKIAKRRAALAKTKEPSTA